jgi:hypothetical protein
MPIDVQSLSLVRSEKSFPECQIFIYFHNPCSAGMTKVECSFLEEKKDTSSKFYQTSTSRSPVKRKKGSGMKALDISAQGTQADIKILPNMSVVWSASRHLFALPVDSIYPGFQVKLSTKPYRWSYRCDFKRI